MEQTAPTKNLLVELAQRKIEAQKTGSNGNSFKKFQQSKSRYATSSAVGPARGGRNKQGK